jgi:hypothetical protein
MNDGSIIMMVYLAFALSCIASDAFITYLCRHRYNSINSICLGLLWPVTCVLIILGVIKAQSKRNRKRNRK